MMTAPAQITICGALGKDAIAALVEVAMNAGAALMVQPRPVVGSVALLQEATPAPPLTVRSRGPIEKRRAAAAVERREVASGDRHERIQRALRKGPISIKELRAATGLSHYNVQCLIRSGALVATGTTTTRRVSLPGSAKEEP